MTRSKGTVEGACLSSSSHRSGAGWTRRYHWISLLRVAEERGDGDETGEGGGVHKHPSVVGSRWESRAFLGRGACMHLCESSEGVQGLFFFNKKKKGVGEQSCFYC